MALEDITSGLDEIFRSNYVSGQSKQSYKKQNPGEFAKVDAYLKGGAVPSPWPATLMGSGLTKIERGRRGLVVPEPDPEPEPPPPPPPPDPTAYFVGEYADGLIKSPWTLAFSYAGDGTHDVPLAATPDGRVAVVNDPAGGAGKCWRSEIRDGDPGWPPLPTSQKAQVRTTPNNMFDKSQVAYGDVRWFATQMYLPYTASEKFDWPGSSGFTTYLGYHTGSPTGSSAFRFGWDPWLFNSGNPYYQNQNTYANIMVFGGPENSTTYLEIIPLFRLTNSDATRYMPNYNRWIPVVWGMKFNPDNTGWLEVWVDGANIYPRKSRPTMWIGDFSQYLIHGLYKQVSASYPSEASVMYFGRFTIGYERPF